MKANESFYDSCEEMKYTFPTDCGMLKPGHLITSVKLIDGKVYDQNDNYIGIELNEKYIEIANNRLTKELGLFA